MCPINIHHLREGGKEGWKEGSREGRKERRKRERGKEEGKEGGRENKSKVICPVVQSNHCLSICIIIHFMKQIVSELQRSIRVKREKKHFLPPRKRERDPTVPALHSVNFVYLPPDPS